MVPWVLLALAIPFLAVVTPATGADEPEPPRRSRMSVHFPESPVLIDLKRGKWGHHFVRPQINGVALGWFAIDTGTTRTFISRAVARRLRLPRIGTSTGTGIGGRTHKALLRLKRLTLGDLEVSSLPVGALDLHQLRLGLGEPPVGVLGMDVLARCVVVYDQAGSRMALHDPASYTLPKGAGAWQSLDTARGKPVVTMAVEGHAGRYEIDTGNPGGMVISPWTVERWSLLRGRPTTRATIGGLGGGVDTRRGRLASVTWGGRQFEDIAADFVLDAHGAAADRATDGLIGTDLLARFIVVIDMTNGRIAYLARD